MFLDWVWSLPKPSRWLKQKGIRGLGQVQQVQPVDENLTVGSPTSHRFCTTVRDRCPVVDAVSVREGSIAGILIRLRNPRGSGGVGSKDPPSHPPLERSARCPPFREDVAFTEGVKGTGLGGLFSRRGPFSGARGFALARCNTETGYLSLIHI